jgi:hypothetical protein
VPVRNQEGALRSSEQELRELFEPLFDVEELQTLKLAGKYRPHIAVKALLRRRQ